MSALDFLLGPAPQPSTGVRTMVGQSGLPIHLHDDDRYENIVMYSVPGQIPDGDALLEMHKRWRKRCRHPDHPQAQALVVADPADRNVYLVEVWPRELMDICALERALTRHEERGVRAREWLTQAR